MCKPIWRIANYLPDVIKLYMYIKNSDSPSSLRNKKFSLFLKQSIDRLDPNILESHLLFADSLPLTEICFNHQLLLVKKILRFELFAVVLASWLLLCMLQHYFHFNWMHRTQKGYRRQQPPDKVFTLSNLSKTGRKKKLPIQNQSPATNYVQKKTRRPEMSRV